MGFFHLFFGSSMYRTLKAYALFLTFLNVPYLLMSLIGKAKFIMASVCEGSTLMLSVQASLLKWLVDWIGSLVGKKGLFEVIQDALVGLTSADIASATIVVAGVLLAMLCLHFTVKIIGRFVPALAALHAHHRSSPWGILYLVLLVIYIVIAIIA